MENNGEVYILSWGLPQFEKTSYSFLDCCKKSGQDTIFYGHPEKDVDEKMKNNNQSPRHLRITASFSNTPILLFHSTNIDLLDLSVHSHVYVITRWASIYSQSGRVWPPFLQGQYNLENSFPGIPVLCCHGSSLSNNRIGRRNLLVWQ